MTRTKRFLFIALALLVLAALAAAWLLRQPTPAAEAPSAPAEAPATRPALAVTVAAPQAMELAQTLAANGNVAAWQEAVVGAESNGLRLAEVRVNVGDTVKKGQVLAVFAGETVQAELARLKANLAEAEAQAADAQGNAERARTLEKTGALSQQQINQYLTAAQTAKARVEAARAAAAAQQVHSRNTQVLAPDAGVISSRTATVGSVVNAGAELFRLVRQSRLEWRAEVASSALARIAPGTPAVVTAASGEQVRGTVRVVAPTVDPQTRNALVYVDLPDALRHAGIKAGMFASGEFALGQSRALTVPLAAVVPRDGFNHVLLLLPDSRVRLAKVQTGRRVGERVEITSELPADARIVAQGAGFLNDGDLVRVVEAPEPKSASATATPAQAATK
ncbi:efflux RND transporter periplasmic adaptor subunit [Comamonas humi]